MWRRLPPALQQRDFGFLWSAILSMRFAENMIAVAVGWQVYAIHRDPLDLGLVGLASSCRCRSSRSRPATSPTGCRAG